MIYFIFRLTNLKQLLLTTLQFEYFLQHSINNYNTYFIVYQYIRFLLLQGLTQKKIFHREDSTFI